MRTLTLAYKRGVGKLFERVAKGICAFFISFTLLFCYASVSFAQGGDYRDKGDPYKYKRMMKRDHKKTTDKGDKYKRDIDREYKREIESRKEEYIDSYSDRSERPEDKRDTTKKTLYSRDRLKENKMAGESLTSPPPQIETQTRNVAADRNTILYDRRYSDTLVVYDREGNAVTRSELERRSPYDRSDYYFYDDRDTFKEEPYDSGER